MSYQSPDSLCPHHDGSELYVSNSAPKVGDKVVLRVRVPHSYTFARSFVRLYHDGEPRSFELALERRDATESWWAVKVKICLLYTSPSPRDGLLSRMPSSA